MKLAFIYQPVVDLAEAAAFYRDQLGFDEAWREAEDTVSFWMPDRAAQIMVSTDPGPAGPMYLVDSVAAWVAEHPQLVAAFDPYEIPGGSLAGFVAPGGNVFYILDQPDG